MNNVSKKLELKNISKGFSGNLVLKNTSFEAISGEIHALLGANGAGKSTLMNILGGNLLMDNGEILINNSKIAINNPRDAAFNKIAFVHQELSILPTMNVAENIFINKFPKKNNVLINKKKTYKDTKIILKRLGCNFSPDTICEFLSTGEQQMVEIGRALAENPNIIIFDEPTSSLDEENEKKIMDLIAKFKNDKIIIVITHKNKYLSTFDKVYHLKNKSLNKL